MDICPHHSEGIQATSCALCRQDAEIERLQKIEPQFLALQAERVRWRSDNERLTADNDRLRAENANILKAVLCHFGPKGANKVCTSVLEARAALKDTKP